MSEVRAPGSVEVDEEALRKAAEFVEAEEGVTNRLKGWLAPLVTMLAIGVSTT